MKIYFDMCSLQRPLDDQSALRVQLETQAVLGLLAHCESGKAEMVASDALVFESDANTDPVRGDFAEQAIAKAAFFIQTSAAIKANAQSFVEAGIKPLDALHLASAIAAKADFLCTCDDRFLKRARTVDTKPTKVVSPFELVSEIQK